MSGGGDGSGPGDGAGHDPGVAGAGPGSDGTSAERAAADLADRLLQAHRRLREVDLPVDDKGRAARRLLAISDASKHDVGRAAARLEVFLADLDEGRVAPQ